MWGSLVRRETVHEPLDDSPESVTALREALREAERRVHVAEARAKRLQEEAQGCLPLLSPRLRSCGCEGAAVA